MWFVQYVLLNIRFEKIGKTPKKIITKHPAYKIPYICFTGSKVSKKSNKKNYKEFSELKKKYYKNNKAQKSTKKVNSLKKKHKKKLTLKRKTNSPKSTTTWSCRPY